MYTNKLLKQHYHFTSISMSIIKKTNKQTTTTKKTDKTASVSNFSEVIQSCLTLCDPMDYSLPGSSVHRIFQARILEWVAISFSRRSSWPRDRTWVSCTAGRLFNVWAIKEAPVLAKMWRNWNPCTLQVRKQKWHSQHQFSPVAQ